MEFLDRYLQAVGRHLPAARKADILAELRANLEAQIEEREEQLGRPLTPVEAEAWIRALGSPLQMASRYMPQQYLIGPTLFPIYWYVIRLVLVWATAIYLVVQGVLMAVNGGALREAAEALFRLPGVLVTALAWVTLIFAALEYGARRYPAKCAPILQAALNMDTDALPALDEEPKKGCKQPSYARAAAEFIFTVLFLGWLLLIPANPFLLMGPGIYYYESLPYRIGPMFLYFYWALVVLNVLKAAWSGYNLYTGAWMGPRRLEKMVTGLAGFIPVVVLLSAPGHVLFVLRNPGADEASLHTLYTVNEGVHMALMIAAVIAGLQLVMEVARAVRATVAEQQ